MNAARSFATFAAVLTLLGSFAPTRAGSVVLLNNLDQLPQPTGSSPFVGQSFISGSPELLQGARMQLDPAAVPAANITLEVEARNADGTVGQTLFSDFTSSYDPRSGLVTFLANSPFAMAADTGYWLVLSDSTTGSVTWDFTASQVYQSSFGYGLPSYNTAFYSDQDNGMGNVIYYQPSDGPQMFQLLTIPEPTSVVLLSTAMSITVLAMRDRHARGSRLPRPRAGHAAGGAVRP